MPISLENSSNIRVTYNTGSNYVIETVKSDLYVRGTTSGNLSPEPTVSPSIRTTDIVVETFTYTTGTTQTTYTKVFSENTLCDILIVGGGGGGGQQNSGGGGAGGLVLVQNINMIGSYTINVGSGGAGGPIQQNGLNGNNSSITKSDNSVIITAIGGGGGGAMGNNGNNGGSGGGGSWFQGAQGSQTQKSITHTGISAPAILNQFGENGGHGGGGTGSYPGGGGGGAGSAGYTNGNDESGSPGGSGIDRVGSFIFKDMFNSSIGDNGWFSGGGGSGGSWGNGSGNGGVGLFGGGGTGFINSKTAINNGINGTGGGGGSARDPSSTTGGSGGSGIVIIRYRSLAAAPTSVNMVKTLNFNYYSSLSPTIYTLTFNTRTLATINNGSDKLLNGSYTITLGNTLSTIVPTTVNQNLQDTKYSSSTISVSYHTLNPILDTRGAQWTYSSTNPNVYHLGSVGIGTTSPEYSLDVRGNIFTSVGGYTQTGTENWIIQSDRRIKENIVKASYEKCLDNIKKIELYNFNFKENYVKTNDRNQLGFIAQEVQEVYPKAVMVKPDGRIEDLLTLNTTQIKYTLYGAVKSLIEKVENLEMRVDKLYKIAIPDVDIIEIFESTSNISIITSNISRIT
jgi:hypothetical protein